METESLKLLLWGLFSLFGIIVFVFLLKNLGKQKLGSSYPLPTSSTPSIPLPSVTRDMSFALLQLATDNFSPLRLIKVGHSGEFFAGVLIDGGMQKIVVKKGHMANLMKELELYTYISDRNCLVPLLGYCREGKESFYLIYEYMAEGDVATLLARKNHSFPWIVRLKIAVEVSESLCFLHSSCSPPVLHNDVKSSSILVGANYEARMGSLSKARRVEEEELLSYDVRCFGMLLMDLISGRRLGEEEEEDPYAQEWLRKVMACSDANTLLRLIDPTLIVEEDFAKEIVGMATIAKACLIGANWLTMKVVRQAFDQLADVGAANGEQRIGSMGNALAQLHRTKGCFDQMDVCNV